MLYFVSVILLTQQGGLLVAFLESIYNKSFLFTMYCSLLKVIQIVLLLLLGPKLEETSIQIASNRFPIIFVLRALRDLPGNFHILLLCTLKLFLHFLKRPLNVSEIIFTWYLNWSISLSFFFPSLDCYSDFLRIKKKFKKAQPVQWFSFLIMFF